MIINKIKFYRIIFLVFNFINLTVYSQLGIVDTSFNANNFDNQVNSICIQQDGKIIVGGSFTNHNGVSRNSIARLNEDGSLDFSFNPGTGFNSFVRSACLQPDGKIIVGGLFTAYNGFPVNRIVRLNTDATIDTTFSIGSGFNNEVKSICIQPDGKILIGGNFSIYDGIPKNKIVRINPDGSNDLGFDIGSGLDGECLKVNIQDDGKIIAGGLFSTFNGISRNCIVRILTNGQLDNSFNIGSGFNSFVAAICIQPDGKILAGGLFTTFNGQSYNRIIRLNVDGTSDNSFVIGTGFNSSVNSIAMQNDGKILAGGNFTTYNSVNRNRFIRLFSDGNLDSTYATGSNSDNVIHQISILGNNKILINGGFTSFNGALFKNISMLYDCNPFYITESITSCGSYTWRNGITYTNSNFTAGYAQTNIGSCDSIYTLNLTIIPLAPLSVTNIGNGSLLSSYADTYQWINCLDNSLLLGENSNTLILSQNGEYACIGVYSNGCIDTSNCITISNLGINEGNLNSLNIYPNPAKNTLTIQGIETILNYKIIESSGKILLDDKISADYTIDISSLNSGIYTIQITSNEGVKNLRFVKE